MNVVIADLLRIQLMYKYLKYGSLCYLMSYTSSVYNPGLFSQSRDYKDNEIQMIYIIPIAQLILYQCLVYLFVVIIVIPHLRGTKARVRIRSVRNTRSASKRSTLVA